MFVITGAVDLENGSMYVLIGDLHQAHIANLVTIDPVEAGSSFYLL